jgi:F-type H+-transporting ATPase subunit gamma
VPSLKAIRKRISSVKSTQKITKAMKMVAGARLNRAQQRITELRPYAVKTGQLLSELTARLASEEEVSEVVADTERVSDVHPLLVTRPEQRVLMLVLTSDRGLCGAFNSNINKRAEREWKTRKENGQDVKLVVVGRKGRDYLARRGAEIDYMPGVWDKLSHETAKTVGRKILDPFLRKDVDAIYIVYNEFKSAMSQNVVAERLLPVPPPVASAKVEGAAEGLEAKEFQFEPDRTAILDVLAPMYVDISILRALYESVASELGARMTAMDSATKNASEMIDSLTLAYNKARQAAITKELMEIIGGSEAIKE